MYKAGGLFGELANTIHGAEFTPRDLYQLKIWDEEFQWPASCADGSNNTSIAYCQIRGNCTLFDISIVFCSQNGGYIQS